MGLSNSVWERGRLYPAVNTSHDLSKRAYAFLISFWTAAGIASSAVAASFSLTWTMSWGLLLIPFVVAIAGIFIALRSDNPFISFIGYMMVTIPFGLMTGPMVALYTTASVVKVLGLTTMIVVGMGIIGAIHPGSLEHWGGFLFGGLLLLIVAGFALPLLSYAGLNVAGALTIYDILAVLLFSAYVIYDLNRAMALRRTHDNAIDVAVAVYLDFINIFLHLLRLMGESSNND